MEQWEGLRWRTGFSVDRIENAINEMTNIALNANMAWYERRAVESEGTDMHGYSLAIWLIARNEWKRRHYAHLE